MKLFRRKNQNEVLPDEVQDYYRTEQQDRMGMAWVLAVGGFILTAAIVVGLFFGGRWAYQSFFNDDNGVGTTAEVDEDERADGAEVLPDTTDESEDETDEVNETDSALEEEIDTEESENTGTDAVSPAAGGETALPRTGPATQE